MLTYPIIHQALLQLADPARATHSQRFFKTGAGEYAEGDVFVGITVPNVRVLVKRYGHINLKLVVELLHSKLHEERLLAVLILVKQFQTGDKKLQEQIFKLYLSNTRYINNWDLVDSSAEHIVGGWIEQNPKLKALLPKLAKSTSLWEKRISIIATFHFIKLKQPTQTLQIAQLLLRDKHDLIHKAVGWMLREVGKRCSQAEEEAFLKKYYRVMPRTMLRYAIEHFPEKKRLAYLAGTI